MHEYSIVQSLMEQIEAVAAENSAEKVAKVVLKIGVMSGVEPHLLESAFDTFKEKTICEYAELEMKIQPLVILCEVCQTQSELEQAHYLCPRCSSLDVRVVEGEDMLLMRLELSI